MPSRTIESSSQSSIPSVRIRVLVDVPARTDGAFVIYWMTAARRTRFNFALDRAVELARELKLPLVILEPLRVDYAWASDRLHRFVIDGMRANQRALAGTTVHYHPFVEPVPGAGKGLLERLAEDAAAVVTDDSPAFFLPRMLAAVAKRLAAGTGVRIEAIDSNGLLPLRAAPKAFARAYDFRRFLQRELRPHLDAMPRPELVAPKLPPLASLPADVLERWPAADLERLGADSSDALTQLPIDHRVAPAPFEGGAEAGRAALGEFLDARLTAYGEGRNQPESDTSSGLSPYLHFGHIGAHEALWALAEREGWAPSDMTELTSGKRTGWWSMSPGAEAFLDQLITWREVGFNGAHHGTHHDTLACLPDWARATLELHAADPRPYVYTLEQFERAATHDDLWNAAQNQLRIEGRIHNYLRMLWGKKILHWSASPADALRIMVELNNKYALDGRDPNSSSGILWVLGKYDRAWGPERPVFGKLRYMSGANTRRKLRVGAYIERWNDCQQSLAFEPL